MKSLCCLYIRSYLSICLCIAFNFWYEDYEVTLLSVCVPVIFVRRLSGRRTKWIQSHPTPRN
jgi:hypothetical protein